MAGGCTEVAGPPPEPPESFAAPPTVTSFANPAAGNPAFVEVAIRFKDALLPGDRAVLAAATPYIPHYEFRGVPIVLIAVPRGAIAGLRNHPRIQYVEEGLEMRLAAEVTGWQFENTPLGHNVARAHSLAGAPRGAGVGIAVVDGGVACNLPELQPACAGGANFVDTSDPMRDLTAYGHGTRVAGLIVAAAGNNTGIAGVAPQARLYSLKVTAGDLIRCTNTAAALNYAVTIPEISVINLSFSAPANSRQQKDSYLEHCQSEIDAVARAVSANILVVAAAGNVSDVGDSVGFPARLPGVMAVSGVRCFQYSGASCPRPQPYNTNYIQFWSGSSRGPQVDISASAHNMYVLTPSGVVAVDQGTSLAAPIVSGTAALVLGYRGLGRRYCLQDHLKQYAHKPSSTFPSYYSPLTYGAGLVDALYSVSNPLPC